MNALCLIVDRLHLGYFGAYGNSWIETPAFDQLATQSFVFDQALIDSPRLELLYRSYWQGWHALAARPAPEDRHPLARLLDDRGVHTVLTTDEPEVLDHPLAAAFREYRELVPAVPSCPAEAIADTHLAQCFAQLVADLQASDAGRPLLHWCHLAGMGTTWDAPEELRFHYVVEDDPEPDDSTEVPRVMLARDFDPDEVVAASNAYAAQVTLLDSCLGAFLDFLDNSPIGRETLLLVAGARGFPLGEHQRIGACDDALHGPLVHVPLLVRLPGGAGAGARSQALVEPSDLWATLLDWFGAADRPASPTGKSLLPLVRDEVDVLRQRLGLRGEGAERAIRTPAWYLRKAEGLELFAKPDDLWEANNVADRCHEIVDALGEQFEQYQQAVESADPINLPPLDEILVKGMC